MFALPETITIWNELSDDGSGVKTWIHEQSPARIAYKTEKITDKNGDDYMSKAVCYCESPSLVVDSKVYMGSSGALEPVPESNDVVAVTQTPSGSGSIKKAWL